VSAPPSHPVPAKFCRIAVLQCIMCVELLKYLFFSVDSLEGYNFSEVIVNTMATETSK
jgi:hypothetical protein